MTRFGWVVCAMSVLSVAASAQELSEKGRHEVRCSMVDLAFRAQDAVITSGVDRAVAMPNTMDSLVARLVNISGMAEAIGKYEAMADTYSRFDCPGAQQMNEVRLRQLVLARSILRGQQALVLVIAKASAQAAQ